jgi:hypothetical protein
MQLKGFLKTGVLDPGEGQHIIFALRPRDVSTWVEAPPYISGIFLESNMFSNDLRIFQAPG